MFLVLLCRERKTKLEFLIGSGSQSVFFRLVSNEYTLGLLCLTPSGLAYINCRVTALTWEPEEIPPMSLSQREQGPYPQRYLIYGGKLDKHWGGGGLAEGKAAWKKGGNESVFEHSSEKLCGCGPRPLIPQGFISLSVFTLVIEFWSVSR